VAVLCLGLAMMPLRVHAGMVGAAPSAEAPPGGEQGGEAPAAKGGPSDEPATGNAEGAADEEPAVPESGQGDASAEPPPAEEATQGDATDEVADGEAADGDDAVDGDAAADDAADEPTKTDAAAPGALGPTAAPLRPMQTAAWWTMFGAFAVATTAGVLAGLAERQEDRATRLSTLFDAETGAQPLYADRRSEYEQYLRRGEGYAKAAIGVGVVAGAATIAAITLFAIDARRQHGERAPASKRRVALRVRGGGVEVRF
jgi:hypothetical protein